MADIYARSSRGDRHADRAAAEEVAQRALDSGIAPADIMQNGFVKGIQEVGELFESGEVFLPELMMSADAMAGATEVTNAALEGERRRGQGRIVIGTVQGDVHDIGKAIVIAYLKANGYEVTDLGRDVPADSFLAKAKEPSADVIGMSALLTTTMEEQKKVIKRSRTRACPTRPSSAAPPARSAGPTRSAPTPTPRTPTTASRRSTRCSASKHAAQRRLEPAGRPRRSGRDPARAPRERRRGPAAGAVHGAMNEWDDRFEYYRDSPGHAEGDDLDQVVAWCEPGPGVTALDVATGGGHVARRLRELGCDGDHVRRRCRHGAGRGLPGRGARRSRTRSFDVVVCRVAAHHFTDPARAIREMARVDASPGRVRGHAVRRRTACSGPRSCATRRTSRTTRATSSSRCSTTPGCEVAGRGVLRAGGTMMDDWLSATGCAGEAAARGAAAPRPRGRSDGSAWTDVKWAAQAVKRA